MTRTRDHDRIQRLCQALEGAGLDAIVCSLPANVLLLTGYWPVVGTAIAMVTREGRIAVIAPEDELDLADKGWAEIRSFKPGSLDKITNATEEARDPLRELAAELGITRARIGYEGAMSEPASYAGMMIYGASMPHLLADAIPSSQQLPADELLLELRATKTARELDCIRRSCAVAAEAFEEASAQIRPGMMETEVGALFQGLLAVRGTHGAERAGGFVYCMSGPNAAKAYAAYARSCSRRIARGDLVLVHCNSFVDGYWTDITRTYVIGEPDARAHELRDAVFAARAAALATIRPEVAAKEVDQAARRELQGRGFGENFKHPTGHGVGWVAIDHNARPRLHPASPDVLAPGMVFNVEPAIYIDGFGGIRHCDMVAVTNDGAEVLTPFQSGTQEAQLAA
ncbi:MAG: aminopeptidase P family protein [Acidobacteria bacterium]|nr:aminopeptidase P family protein [Acidobacteriota bacterium]